MARSLSLLFSMMAVLLLLFFLFGGALENWTADTLSSGVPPLALGVLIFVLLAADILLPIPASLLAVAAGAAFGTVAGAAIVAAGLSAGAIIGFFLAQSLGAPFCRKLLSEAEFERVSRLLDCYGPVLLVVLRPVPIFAETSVLAAGTASVSPRRVLAAVTLANVGIAVGYTALGAWAMNSGSAAVVIAASMLIPAFAWIAAKLLIRTRGTENRRSARSGGA